jgi:acyl-CoA synthetase (AMP-forming)/AMP-acid ligase II
VEVPLLVSDFLNRAVKLYAKKEAIVDGAERFSYAEYGARVNQLAQALRALCVQKGDRVAILSPNSHHFMEAFYGVAAIGAIIVPINYRLIASDFEYILNHSGSKVLLADSDMTDIIDEIRPRIPSVEHFIVARFENAPVPQGWLDWEELIAKEPASPPPDPGLSETDIYSINYTSGTTARPKGVMITHRNAYINAYDFIAHMRITHDDVELWTLPMFHANGWGGPFALTAMGAKHVVLRRVAAADIYRLIEDEGVTFACMAPAVLAAILDYPDKSKHQIKTRPRFTIAGAPPPVRFVERLEKELGWEFFQIYGLTETSPILTVAEVKPHLKLEGDRLYQVKARAGHDAIGVDIRVFGANGVEVPWDDMSIGEVAAHSNVVFKGYWEQPEETSKAIRDGWFYTGDLATVNADGYINIVDRAKDVIISGGENISSIEVEDVLYKHPAVLEAAVIGVPSEQWGETPMAVVVLREGQSATEQELIEHCRANMAHFKAPHGVRFVAALPRTATGKLKKFELREEFWEGVARRVN